MFVPHRRPSVSQPEAPDTNFFQWPAGARRWPSFSLWIHAVRGLCRGGTLEEC